nr:MAG TPA: hypothetical protein [Bacteriophage sp.]
MFRWGRSSCARHRHNRLTRPQSWPFRSDDRRCRRRICRNRTGKCHFCRSSRFCRNKQQWNRDSRSWLRSHSLRQNTGADNRNNRFFRHK